MRPGAVNWSFQVMMRGSNVTRSTPGAGTSVRSTACAARLAPPGRAGHVSRRAVRRVRISKTAPAGWRMPCSLPRRTSGVRAQGTAGIAEPDLALIASTKCLAGMRGVAALGWTASQEKANPNGVAEKRFGWALAVGDAGDGGAFV